MPDNFPVSHLNIPLTIKEARLMSMISDAISAYLPRRWTVNNIQIEVVSALLQELAIKGGRCSISCDLYIRGTYSKSIMELPFKTEIQVTGDLAIECRSGLPIILITELIVQFLKPLELNGKFLRVQSPAVLQKKLGQTIVEKKDEITNLINQQLRVIINNQLKEWTTRIVKFSLNQGSEIDFVYNVRKLSWQTDMVDQVLTFNIDLLFDLIAGRDSESLDEPKAPILQCGVKTDPWIDVQLSIPLALIESNLKSMAINVSDDKKVQIDQVQLTAIDDHNLSFSLGVSGDFNGKLNMSSRISNVAHGIQLEIDELDVDLNNALMENLFALVRKSVKRIIAEKLNKSIVDIEQKLRAELKGWLKQSNPWIEIVEETRYPLFNYTAELADTAVILNMTSKRFRELRLKMHA